MLGGESEISDECAVKGKQGVECKSVCGMQQGQCGDGGKGQREGNKKKQTCQGRRGDRGKDRREEKRGQ